MNLQNSVSTLAKASVDTPKRILQAHKIVDALVNQFIFFIYYQLPKVVDTPNFFDEDVKIYIRTHLQVQPWGSKTLAIT